MPMRAPLFLAKSLLTESRERLRNFLAAHHAKQQVLINGSHIGKTHRLIVNVGDAFASRLSGAVLYVTLPVGVDPQALQAQAYIKEAALKALRTQSKAYLSRRLAALADVHGFTFTSI